MTLEVDQIIDRRRLKRRLVLWRIFGVFATLAAIILALNIDGQFIGKQDYIARMTIKGVIFDDPKRHELLAVLSRDKKIKALIIRINSPGGTVVGGEALYHSIQKFSKYKPVVAIMGETATSAAYMVSIAADQIFARAGSITGSIGVLMQTADLTRLLEKIGIKPESIKSSALKAQPNPMEPFSDKAREATRLVVLDLYKMFISMVQERRKLSYDKIIELADGRIFTGRQALKNGLLDELGGEAEALKWLENKGKVSGNLPVKDVGARHFSESWLEFFNTIIGKIVFSERLRLDGPISVWHPELV